MRCANGCAGAPECERVDCCHVCLLFVDAECANDGSYAFVPRYFVHLAQA